MPNTVDQILEQNHVSIPLDGMTFVLRKITAQVLFAAVGGKAVSLLEAIQAAEESEDRDVGEFYRVIKQVLEIAMVSPRLAETTDSEADTIGWLDLGDYSGALFNALWQATQPEEASNFPESSRGQRE